MAETIELPIINFEKYVVAFIDILGFSNFIKEAEKRNSDENKQLRVLLKVLDENPVFKNELNENIFLPKDMGLICRQISDSFIITAPCSKSNDNVPTLLGVSIKAIQIYQALLSIGLSVRGGIAVGNLFIEDDNIYGSAFLDAYETESIKAIYPRILLHHTAVKELNDLHEYKYKRPSYFVQLDNDIFLDSFFDVTLISKKHEDITTILKKFKTNIEVNLVKKLEPKIRNKWAWIALHLNAHIEYYQLEVEKINVESIFSFQLDYLNPVKFNWINTDITDQ
jgi:hypothetical protein